MEKESPLFVWSVVAMVALAIWLLVRMRRAKAEQAERLGGAGGAANAIATGSGRVLRKIPLVGGVLDSMFNAPVTNVTSGDVGATVTSAVTGGLSDLFHWKAF